jgi:PAS domain S-box-containing protein
MVVNMSITDKTKEELIIEWTELNKALNSVIKQGGEEISLLKHELEKVKKSEEIFRKAYMTSPDSININRLSDGMFISVNEGFTKITGYTEEETIGKTSLELDIWAEPENRKSLAKLLQEEGKVENFEAIFRKKDNSIAYGSMSASLIDLDRVPHILSVTRDITEKKKSEERLFLLANALKSISECVSITDINDNILFLNESFLNTYGFEPGELEGKIISLVRSPDNPEEIVNKILPATIKGGWHGELMNRRKDGSEFPISLSTSVVKNDRQEPVALIGVASDITMRRRKELQSQIIYEITQGVSTTSNLDELLKLIHYSLAKSVYAENCFVALFDEKTGLFNFPYFVDKIDSIPKSMPIGKSCTAYVFRNKKPFLFNQGIFDDLVEKNEVELVGSFSPSWIGIPLQTPSKVIGVLVLQHYEKENVYSESDVKFLVSIGSQIAISIERKKAEEEIKLANLQLQNTNAEKDSFFSILAHDLRGPLSSFVGATQIMSEEIQTMDIEQIKNITLRMQASASNIYNLLENLLEWSRLKRDGLDFVPVKVNLKLKIEGCIDLFFESARKKRIVMTISIPDELEVFVDNHMFDTVIRNLVSNAIKFTRIGGKVSVTAEHRRNNSIVVRISDTGIGMTREMKNKLFLLDEKNSRQGTEGEPSTGLGLLLCKEFIAKHGGKIWVESEVDKGTVFSFSIPGMLKF